MNSALASLTAQYTDSENEDDLRNDSDDDSQHSQASQVIIVPPKPVTPAKKEEIPPPTESTKTKKKKKSKKVRRLVSYQDDTLISDEEEPAAASESSSSESESSNASEDERNSKQQQQQNISNQAFNHSARDQSGEHGAALPMEVDEDDDDDSAAKADYREKQKLKDSERASKYAHYNFTLPPEPKGKPPVELVEKIQNLYEKMKNSNMDMNRLIQDRKDFRNPSIYEKLIHFCDINEFGTNYPPEIYDPLQWGPESYYEELARVQKNDMIKRQKDRKDMDKIEQATAVARKVEEEAKKRKSKWDQPSSTKHSVQQALTTTVTGTKGTVISAFGSLPKKPAA